MKCPEAQRDVTSSDLCPFSNQSVTPSKTQMSERADAVFIDRFRKTPSNMIDQSTCPALCHCLTHSSLGSNSLSVCVRSNSVTSGWVHVDIVNSNEAL